MKVWEKIMLYPIGLCYWIADSAKKTGNFIGRKAKPAIAMLVAVTMMLSLMPITAFAVSVPNGYTTDENGIMAYAYLLSGNFDIRGYFDGEWKSTTFGNGGSILSNVKSSSPDSSPVFINPVYTVPNVF